MIAVGDMLSLRNKRRGIYFPRRFPEIKRPCCVEGACEFDVSHILAFLAGNCIGSLRLENSTLPAENFARKTR
jgi:hypothetical protein